MGHQFELPFVAKRIRTRYWKPGDDFLKIIADSIAYKCKDGDIIVISEKPISVAMGRVVDETEVRPSLLAKFLVRIWMRFVWGHLLGPLCHLRTRTLWRLRRYPIPEGYAHKQVALQYAGFGQALLHYSEGGIDVTNLPFALASVPLENPLEVCKIVLKAIEKACGKQVIVMIIDTDRTYSSGVVHLTPRPGAMNGIRSLGVLASVFGRMLCWKAQATPLAQCGRGRALSVEEALDAANVADRAMGCGAGRTVWDMARNLRVEITGVTWEMLDRVRHFPIVLVRRVE